MSDFATTDHELSAAIGTLDDASAVRTLATIGPHLGGGSAGQPIAPEAVPTLCAQLGATPQAKPASAGEIARQALLLLAQDAEKRGPIAAMIRNPAPQTFAIGPVSGTLLITFALVALQSHIEFSRDKQGNWQFKYKETRSKASMLEPLIKKLMALIAGGPPKTH